MHRGGRLDAYARQLKCPVLATPISRLIFRMRFVGSHIQFGTIEKVSQKVHGLRRLAFDVRRILLREDCDTHLVGIGEPFSRLVRSVAEGK